MKQTFTNIPIRTSHDVEVYKPLNPKRVFVLLHGYLLNGEFIFKKLRDILPLDCAIIAPNGPFIVPIKKKEKFKPGYAWYFYDSNQKNFYIDYNPGAEFVSSLLIEMGLDKKPITLIGYSQGGYLAPRIADIIHNVDTVIGLACIFRNQRFSYRSNVIYHQIHSKADLVVDFDEAKEEFMSLREKGNIGQFISLEDNGHRLDSDYIETLKDLI